MKFTVPHPEDIPDEFFSLFRARIWMWLLVALW
jgi:hypothetical protein